MRGEEMLLSWSMLRGIGSSRLVQVSAIMPFIGYLIIYSDVVRALYCNTWNDLIFQSDAACQSGSGFSIRLHLLYLGFFVLGVGSIIFSMACPRVVKRYVDRSDYAIQEYSGTSEVNLRYMFEVISNHFPERAKQILTAYGDGARYWEPARWRVDSKHEGEWNPEIENNYRNAKVDVMRDYEWSDHARNRVAKWACCFAFVIGLTFVSIPSAITLVRVLEIIVTTNLRALVHG
jgi:hypothetical protein